MRPPGAPRAAAGGAPCRATNRSRSDSAEEEDAEHEGIDDDIGPSKREGRGPGTGIFEFRCDGGSRTSRVNIGGGGGYRYVQCLNLG